MNEHLPECFALMCECDETHFKSIDCDFSCICPTLRACEERVEEAMDRAWTQTVALAVAHTRTTTLDAAREAIDSMVIETAGNSAATVNQALAAIDALKEKP